MGQELEDALAARDSLKAVNQELAKQLAALTGGGAPARPLQAAGACSGETRAAAVVATPGARGAAELQRQCQQLQAQRASAEEQVR